MTLVACYLPFGVVIAVLAITGQATSSIELAWETTIVIVSLNSSLNPFIYCWKIKEIRQAGKILFAGYIVAHGKCLQIS